MASPALSWVSTLAADRLRARNSKLKGRFSHIFMHYSKRLGAGTVEIENIASNAIGHKDDDDREQNLTQ
jgi:hypothetical protein